MEDNGGGNKCAAYLFLRSNEDLKCTINCNDNLSSHMISFEGGVLNFLEFFFPCTYIWEKKIIVEILFRGGDSLFSIFFGGGVHYPIFL